MFRSTTVLSAAVAAAFMAARARPRPIAPAARLTLQRRLADQGSGLRWTGARTPRRPRRRPLAERRHQRDAGEVKLRGGRPGSRRPDGGDRSNGSRVR